MKEEKEYENSVYQGGIPRHKLGSYDRKGGDISMFRSEKYLTQGVNERIPLWLQLVMWRMIAEIPTEKDYLQVFRLKEENGEQTIIHSQEQPEYSCTVTFKFSKPITEKVFVIDDGDHCTMLLAEEY